MLIVFLLVVLSPGCGSTVKRDATTTPKKTEQPIPKKNPRDQFTFNEDGSVKTKSGQPEKTFNFPDIKVGFIVVAPQLDVLPVLSLEIYEFKKVPFYFDVGISTHLVYLAVGYNVVPIFEVGVFLWGGYHFIDREKVFWGRKFYGTCFGMGLTVIKF